MDATKQPYHCELPPGQCCGKPPTKGTCPHAVALSRRPDPTVFTGGEPLQGTFSASTTADDA